uniref:Ig-like domain-containing protein n=1 Tax=Scleropages formosus TaxID=113540 RepID=A0A8C9TK22_SCLFO
ALVHCIFSITIQITHIKNVHRVEIFQPNLMLMAQPGQNVTLTCSSPNAEFRSIAWFKQNVGQKPQFIVGSFRYSTEYTFYNGFNETKRFVLQKKGNIFNLYISKINPLDSATYYCAFVYSLEIQFVRGTFLNIEERKSTSRTVVQQPVSDPVHPGDSVTLQCAVVSETCAGEQSVYWFRHGSGESLPGLIYTHGNRSDECEKSPEAGSPTHSCVYSLPKRNLSRSDAGIYYCAVVTCGEILFGNGTQLDIEGRHWTKNFHYLFIRCFSLKQMRMLSLYTVLLTVMFIFTKLGSNHYGKGCLLTSEGVRNLVENSVNYDVYKVKYLFSVKTEVE